jgi:hypothetical protein
MVDMPGVMAFTGAAMARIDGTPCHSALHFMSELCGR